MSQLLPHAKLKPERLLQKASKRLRSFLTLSGLRLLDAGIGFIKEILLTKTFGLSAFLDSFLLANSLLDIFSGFCQQMGYAVLLPFYNEETPHDEEAPPGTMSEAQQQLVVAFVNYLFLSMLMLGLTMAIGHQWVSSLLANDLASRQDSHLDLFLMVMLPISMLFQGAQVLKALLVQHERFGLFYLPGIISTGVFIVSFWVLYRLIGFYALMWALPISQCVQFMLYWRYLKIRWHFCWRVPHLGNMLWLALPNTIIWLVYQMFTLVDNYFLTLLPEGELGAFRYAGKVSALVAALTIANQQLTLIPALMTAGSRQNWPELAKLLRKGALESCLFSAPIILIFLLFAPWIIKLLFERGAFDAHDTQLVSMCLQIFILQLPVTGIWMLIVRVFNSLRLSIPFIWIGVISLLLRGVLEWFGLHYGGLNGLTWMCITQMYLMAFIAIVYLVVKRRYFREIDT